MAYRFSHLSGRLVASSQLAAYRPQGVQAYVLPKITPKPAASSQPQTRESSTSYSVTDPFENGFATGITTNAWHRYRNKVHRKRKDEVLFNIKQNDAGIEVFFFKPREKVMYYLVHLIAAFAMCLNIYIWNTTNRKMDWERFGKVKY
ncbi:uncharacterized protein LOC127698365 [Mytilus californianus]|uniref:uncharacterized protein LOC127698365 n=1 Tax=Mytilus californianus TaxID=6549 RepID=UPI0022466313|nr:uncharacterized protein LOC127698365 [Mytilus californianus]